MSSSVIRAGDTWGTGGHAPPRPAPPPPPTHTHTHTHTLFSVTKRKMETKEKVERISKQKLIEGCHQEC